jgi:peptidoglycan/xylan/chitin deacetylase (PgdA/CDA1 family)
MVWLTFDDGPDTRWTLPVLDALDAADAKATFFVVAEQIATDGGAEVLAETLRRGHSVQMHCARHLRHEALDADELRADAQEIESVLAEHRAPEPTLWRPPYGSVHPVHTCQIAAERGRLVIRWSHDTVDYRGLDAATMLAAARGGSTGPAGLAADSVVLMHDSRRYSSTPGGGAAGTVALVEPLVALVRSRGWDVGVRAAPPTEGWGGFLLPCPGAECACRQRSRPRQ